MIFPNYKYCFQKIYVRYQNVHNVSILCRINDNYNIRYTISIASIERQTNLMYAYEQCKHGMVAKPARLGFLTVSVAHTRGFIQTGVVSSMRNTSSSYSIFCLEPFCERGDNGVLIQADAMTSLLSDSNRTGGSLSGLQQQHVRSTVV